MTAIDTTTPAPVGGRILDVPLTQTMSQSYVAYAMMVLRGRALPDVRDGLKPVHRRSLYAMYDQGFRPDRATVKSARVVGEVMGNYHPHGDSAIYDAIVRMAQPWAMRQPLIDGQGNFGSPGNDPAAAMRYTESRLTPLAMELVRDIDEETVDFIPNYDGKNEEPVVLPARFPNLLVNGTEGIAVGMASKIPTHNLREVSDAAQWLLANPDATDDEVLDAVVRFVQGPDFPTGALIAGRAGIEDYLRTGRGSIRMRSVVNIEEDERGRSRLVVTELPYAVNPDTLLEKITEAVQEGRITGIADINDESSDRVGLRLVIEIKRDAVAKVVLNHLYKHSALQTTFGANMVSVVDGIPRVLNFGQMLRYWVNHQVEVITRRTAYRLRKAEERIHVLRGYVAALNALDEVIALIRGAASSEDARTGLMTLLSVDEIQAVAILDMQLRRLAALEAGKIHADAERIESEIADYRAILADPARQRSIISEELAATVDKAASVDKRALPRLTRIVPFEGDLSEADFIVREDVVITITRSGYAKRTKSDLYRSQNRGGKGVRGASLRGDDIVEHFLVTSTHDTLLFFTNQGRVYRAKAYEFAEGSRDAKGQHVANILGFQPEEKIAQVLDITDYAAAPYLVLATKSGLVKKTDLAKYDTNRTGGLIAINLRDGDEVVSAGLCAAADDLLLISRHGQAVRFTATDESVRSVGRDSAGVTGIRFKGTDSLLQMLVVTPEETGDVFVATSAGYAKRTPVGDYPTKNRGGTGVIAANTDGRGDLVGAILATDGDEVFAITAGGGVIRTPIATVRASGRSTKGVRLINLTGEDAVLSIARNPESETATAEIAAGADDTPVGETSGLKDALAAAAERYSVDSDESIEIDIDALESDPTDV